MPWKEWNKVEERLRFIARLLDGEKIAGLCREFDIYDKARVGHANVACSLAANEDAGHEKHDHDARITNSTQWRHEPEQRNTYQTAECARRNWNQSGAAAGFCQPGEAW